MVHHATLRSAAGQPLKSAVPDRPALERVLAQYAPLRPAPLCPEILIHRAESLVDVWEAAERLAGDSVPAPFWAYAWPAGAALARVILDDPELVRGLRVLDLGAGGGIASLAAARAGAADVIANDIDPWALLVASIAADAQQLTIRTLGEDICDDPALGKLCDVVLCSDMSYERREAPRQRNAVERVARAGGRVLVADAGRTYFDATGLTLIAEYDVDVPQDLEGVSRRTARVYRMD